jgi:hypothetical protein
MQMHAFAVETNQSYSVRKNYVNQCYDLILVTKNIRDKIQDNFVWVSMDETQDCEGRGRGVRATKMTVSSSDDWIYWHLGYNISLSLSSRSHVPTETNNHTTIEERCFLCDQRRGVLNKTTREIQSLEDWQFG